jgi:ferredoxin-NADP reductase
MFKCSQHVFGGVSMTIYEVKLNDRKQVAQDTMAFTFEKPSNFIFKAGQFGDFTLENPPKTDAEGNMRVFQLLLPHILTTL